MSPLVVLAVAIVLALVVGLSVDGALGFLAMTAIVLAAVAGCWLSERRNVR